MKRNVILLIITVFVFLSFVFAPTISIAHTSIAQIEKQDSISSMLEHATPAIVNIAVEQILMKKLNDFMPTNDDQTRIPVKTYAVGSGVIFDSVKGLIVTNAHVLKNEKVIVVTLKDGRRYHGSLVAKDADYDIAILKINAPHLTALPFANSDSVRVGDFVTAIGSPYGLSQTVTSGMVSALNRSHPQIEGYQNFIQTDAPINPGNSGGALVNLQGKLIGINTAIVAPSDANAGIGFAIPSNMVDAVIQQLLKYGKVERGIVGILVQNVTPTLANSLKLSNDKGALVSDILPNTPAKTAGFQVTDLITKVNGHSIDSAEQLRNTLGLIRPNTTVAITILRNQQTKILHATIANPKTLKESSIPYFSGVRLQPFHELQPDGTKLEGLLLTDLSDESPSALAGFQVGDVITAINKTPVTSLSDLLQIVAHQTQPLLITVSRGSGHLFLVLETH